MFQAVLEHVDGDPLAVATALGYPIADLALLAIGVGALAGTGWRVDRSWALLVSGILAFWLADSLYLVRAAEGTYESGGWFDFGWWLGLFLITVAAWQPRPAPAAPPVRRQPAADHRAARLGRDLARAARLRLHGELNLLAGLAAAALVFVLIRLTLTFRQNVAHAPRQPATRPTPTR